MRRNIKKKYIKSAFIKGNLAAIKLYNTYSELSIYILFFITKILIEVTDEGRLPYPKSCSILYIHRPKLGLVLGPSIFPTWRGTWCWELLLLAKNGIFNESSLLELKNEMNEYSSNAGQWSLNPILIRPDLAKLQESNMYKNIFFKTNTF